MQSEEFGRLVADAIDKKRGMLRDIDEKRGLRNAVGRLVGKRLAGARGLDSRQVQLVIEGQRHLDHEMVQAFIDVLDLDSDEAWVASTLSRPGVTAEHLRLLRQLDDADDEQAVRAVKKHRSAARRVGRVIPLGTEVDTEARRRAELPGNHPDQATTQANHGSCGNHARAGQGLAIRRLVRAAGNADAWQRLLARAA